MIIINLQFIQPQYGTLKEFQHLVTAISFVNKQNICCELNILTMQDFIRTKTEKFICK